MMQSHDSRVPLDRRSFLRSSLAGASVLALGGLAARGSRAQAVDQAQASDAEGRAPKRAGPPRHSRVAVVRSADFPSHQEATRRVIELAGGLSFIRPGDTVLLKPATNSGNPYPATTDPETVWIMAELVKEAGGLPFIADRTMFLRSTEEVFRQTGIVDAAAQAGISCRYLEDDEAVSLQHPLAEHWGNQTVRLYASVVDSDHIINLCTPRTHPLGDFTMAMKNNVGVVNAWSRLPMHVPWGLKERLAELNLVVRPALILMDGREGFADGGPDSGDLVRPGILAAASDPVAIDAVGLGQLRLHGANAEVSRGSIWEIPMMRRAVEIEVGARSAAEIHLVGMDGPAEAALRAQMA